MKRPRLKSRSAARQPAVRERTLLQAELPGIAGSPLLRIRLEMNTEPQGEGERLRLRAHIQSSFGNAIASLAEAKRPQLGTGSATGLSLPARKAAALLQRGLAHPLARRLAAPLLRHDVHTWLELHASTAPLERGAADLLPLGEKLGQLGVQLPPGDGPLAQTWAGETEGPRAGYAQFSLLRLDKRHLPPLLASLLGKKPFQMAAALASVVERHTSEPSPEPPSK